MAGQAGGSDGPLSKNVEVRLIRVQEGVLHFCVMEDGVAVLPDSEGEFPDGSNHMDRPGVAIEPWSIISKCRVLSCGPTFGQATKENLIKTDGELLADCRKDPLVFPIDIPSMLLQSSMDHSHNGASDRGMGVDGFQAEVQSVGAGLTLLYDSGIGTGEHVWNRLIGSKTAGILVGFPKGHTFHVASHR